MVEERLQRGEVAAVVEHADRLRMEVELSPADDLGELLERAEPAGERNERVGAGGHLGLPLVERLDDDELAHPRVRELALDEPARDHADDLAAGRKRTV